MTTPETDIDRLTAAFFEAFDNRDGRHPSAERFKEMFAEEAIIIRLAAEGPVVMDVTAFVAPRIDLLTSGRLTNFHEWETEGQTIVKGNIATRFSTYAKDGQLDRAAYSGTGRKIAQLFRKEGRWLIASLLWEDD